MSKSDNESDAEQIVFKPDAALNLALKIVLLLVIVFFPIFILYMVQIILSPQPDNINPLTPEYIIPVGFVIGWYVIGLAYLLPNAGRLIDRYVERKFGSGTNSAENDEREEEGHMG